MLVLLLELGAFLEPLLPNDNPSANELLRTVVTNELRLQEADNSHWKFEAASPTPTGSRRKQVIETKDGEIDALLAVDGRPLTRAEEQNEDARIQQLVNDPSRQRKQKRDQAQTHKKPSSCLRCCPMRWSPAMGSARGNCSN